MWLKVDVSKTLCDGERKFFVEMNEGRELSCVYIFFS